MTSPRVGIFFKAGDQWLIDAVELDAGEPYGEAIQHGGHYDYWESLVPSGEAERRLANHSYDYFPRGRTVYFPRRQTFRIYADPCLSASDLAAVAEAFGIADRAPEFPDDIHYRCSRCNGDFID